MEVYLNVKKPFVIENQNDVAKFNEYYMKHKPNLFTEENMKLSSEARDKLVSE
jgi:hypothetical protein